MKSMLPILVFELCVNCYIDTIFPFSYQISDPEKCDEIFESLARINSSVYRQQVCIFTILFRNTAINITKSKLDSLWSWNVFTVDKHQKEKPCC